MLGNLDLGVVKDDNIHHTREREREEDGDQDTSLVDALVPGMVCNTK